ncbi:SGNH/GDSL hydrolase family protein [Rhodococcus maanshanensis]|uniref:Lysophospholipase L1 n=1 Tax=Rhodococcus maanshanensis TaxID=183556 RepID=A0A1H7MM41_9NOCA|nr:SGNH/GDSL hydrolase family protein [Rhodococcus maanshanensis]SEL12376.1 Lysophospholipase L1 [Rhodococcus maanshanensis]
MRKVRWCDVALLAFAAVTLIGLAAVARPSAGESSAVPQPTMTVQRPSTDPQAPPAALFIGDSYTQGSESEELTYACQAAAQAGWQCAVAAFPGTGYISGGPANRFDFEYLGESDSFVERIQKLGSVYRPDIVVLDGGRNDGFPPADDVYKAMVSTIGEARRIWPEAEIVFIRPRFLADPRGDAGFGDDFMRRLESDPAAAGVRFVDPIAGAPFAGGDTSGLLAADGVHPNLAGDRQISAALAAALVASGAEGAR